MATTMPLQVPAKGLNLSRPKTGPSKDGNKHSHILSLDLAENKTKELLKALQSGNKVSLHSGRQPRIQYADNRLPLQTTPSKYPSELYTRSQHDETALYFSGALSHTLESRDAVEASAGANSALEALQSTLKSMKEERALNETHIVRGREDLKKPGKGEHKASPLLGYRKELLGGAPRSTPSSPYLSASYSPRPPPTSAPALAGAATGQDKIRQDAMKITIIHLLASKPMSSKAVQDTIRASKDDCDRVLERQAQDSQSMSGKKELKQRAYRDLDVWKFPYDNPNNRAAAIERAIHAYDRMRVEKSDPLWQMLLKPEERGKGKVLSKLNFNKPTPTPKPHESKEDTSETDPVRSPKKSSTSTRKPEKIGLNVDKATSKHRGSSPAVQKNRDSSSKPLVRSVKPESRFKSSEVIEDSDEEAKAADEGLAKPKAAKKQEPSVAPANSSIKKTTSPSPKKQLHKSTISNPSSASDSSDSQTSKATLKPPVRDSSTYSKRSPRPRNDSSPQKPSPLGSSPPTTSTDADSSSSNKGTSQSSAPSSPPSSTDMPVAKQKHKYSPIITDRARDVSRGRVATKRKANELEEAPAPKRQQMDRPNTPKLTNGLHKHTDRPHLDRKISESERSSSPEKPGPVREDVVDQAKRFQLYYKKYKDLHEKIANIPEKDREDKETEDLWKMHERLAEMKTDIWRKWEKLEKEAT